MHHSKNIVFFIRPMIELTIPSSLDPTVAPPGAHVAQFFVQYTPYTLAGGKQWDEQSKQAFADAGEKRSVCLSDSLSVRQSVSLSVFLSVVIWAHLALKGTQTLINCRYPNFISVFDTVEEYAPGFKDSIIGTDILMPPDLERILGLTGGVST